MPSMLTRTALSVTTGLVILTPIPASAQVSPAFDPRGIYHNQFSGGFPGTEWFQVIPIAGVNRYRVADIFGGGFDATILPNGQVTLDGGIGAGSFSTDDAWIINPSLGGTPFVFNSLRAPDTGPDFPLTFNSISTGNPLLAGVYRSLTEQLNPRTGALISGGFENVTISIQSRGTAFRITDPGGLYFQGGFESPNDAVFRVVSPTPADLRFRSFTGSAINFTQNMLGRATIEDINNFTAIILLQSRTALGNQTQLAFRFTATRINPLALGDVNGDGAIDQADADALALQLGLDALDDGFNIAADLNGDDAIDAADAAILADILNPGCNPADLAEAFGTLDINDVLIFANAFNAMELTADFFADGMFDINDVLTFAIAFNAGCP